MTTPSDASQAVELPTNEEIELFAAKLVREQDLPWLGFRQDTGGRYTIPVVSQSVGELVRAAIAQDRAARAQAEPVAWINSRELATILAGSAAFVSATRGDGDTPLYAAARAQGAGEAVAVLRMEIARLKHARDTYKRAFDGTQVAESKAPGLAFAPSVCGWPECSCNEPLCADAPAAAATNGQPTLTERLQQKCSDWNTYWRASDAHGVILSPAQAVELLQDALGVEVELQAEVWQLQFLTDVTTAAGLIEHGKRDKGLAERIGAGSMRWRQALTAPTIPQAAEVPGCDPTQTECKRCRNVIANCDGVFAAAPTPTASAPKAEGEAVSEREMFEAAMLADGYTDLEFRIAEGSDRYFFQAATYAFAGWRAARALTQPPSEADRTRGGGDVVAMRCCSLHEGQPFTFCATSYTPARTACPGCNPELFPSMKLGGTTTSEGAKRSFSYKPQPDHED